jgi:hypothetical protein
MNDRFVGAPDPRQQNELLAQWLYALLASKTPGTAGEQIPIGEDVSFPRGGYHAAFYPQLPDFALALLRGEAAATTRYAPLLFHLLGCPVCHRAYLETYDALRVALADASKPAAITLHLPAASNLSATSPKLLVFLCQLLVGQARLILRQAHREPEDADAWARSLLQQAMGISRYIMQGTLRQRALRDLVEVASLAAPAAGAAPASPATLSYAACVGTGSGSRGRRMRRAEMLSRPGEQVSIELRANSLEGTITQEGELLILRLIDLDERLRGKFLLISVLLGTLLEPVRWLGGNPYAIRSSAQVGSDGVLVTALGRTELLMSNPEDRNLLETLFKKLDIRPLDS